MVSKPITLGAGVLIHKDGRLLVVRRAEEPDIGLWAFPGGRVEVGETPEETAVREAKEEVGLDVALEGVFDVVTYPPRGRWSQVVIVDYLARPVAGTVRLNGESSEFRWVLPSELQGLETTTQMKDCARKFEKTSPHRSR